MTHIGQPLVRAQLQDNVEYVLEVTDIEEAAVPGQCAGSFRAMYLTCPALDQAINIDGKPEFALLDLLLKGMWKLADNLRHATI